MTKVREQLRNQSIGTVDPSSFLQVGSSVFPDVAAKIDLDALIQIVGAYATTHAPTYGQAIPNTGFQTVGIENGVAVEASANEVLQIQGVNVTNGGGAAPIEVKMSLGDVIIWNGVVAPNVTSGTQDIIPSRTLQIVKGSALTFTVTSGTASDMNASIAGFKSIQG